MTTYQPPFTITTKILNLFEFIHPFIDGNGRIGRFWQSLILYQWKPIFATIAIESLINDFQEEYYDALEELGSKGESTPFIEFMLKIIAQTCQKLLSENQDVPLSVPENVPLKRLEQIVALIQENKEITIEQIALECGVSSKTIKRDIAKLKANGKVKRAGSAKSGYWEILE